MPLPIEFNDLWFTPDGDLMLSDSGDLRDTRSAEQGDEHAAIRQFIIHRLLAERGGWPTAPEAGAGLERFIGRPIDETLFTQMAQVIKVTLTFDGLLLPGDVEVRVVPLNEGAVAAMIWAKKVSDKPMVSFVYDIQQGSVIRVR